ncbi:hypothetical protein BHE74_00043013 [Ensete ventricosum]|nr:hypothetical protein BHE74_00043013 [Ensete ventricosum]
MEKVEDSAEYSPYPKLTPEDVAQPPPPPVGHRDATTMLPESNPYIIPAATAPSSSPKSIFCFFCVLRSVRSFFLVEQMLDLVRRSYIVLTDQPRRVSPRTTWTTTSATRQPGHARPEIAPATLDVVPTVVGPVDPNLGNRRRRRSVQDRTPVQP